MTVRKFLAATTVVCLGVIALAGCRSEEQGRIMKYEPGVYKGQPDQKLSEDQTRVLRQRTIMQGGSLDAPTGGGGTRDVRKPEIDSGALNQRTQNQKGS